MCNSINSATLIIRKIVKRKKKLRRENVNLSNTIKMGIFKYQNESNMLSGGGIRT